MLTGALVALIPAVLLAFAVRVCDPFPSEAVLRLKLQLLVPEAVEKLPPSTETCTEARANVSDAVPVTLIVPETAAPFNGAVIAAAGVEVSTLMLKVLDAEFPAASFT